MDENNLTPEQLEKRQKKLDTQRRYREKNRDNLNEKNREYRKNNKEIVRESNRKWSANNRDKVNEKQRRYAERNKEKLKLKQHQFYLKNKDKVKEFSLLRKYNISLEQYKKMLKDQHNKCLLCQTKDEDTTSKFLVVDHCHKTGKVRGLLCNPCNTGIGLFKENIEVLEKTIKYLAESSLLTVESESGTVCE
jgi:hypothetical protein